MTRAGAIVAGLMIVGTLGVPTCAVAQTTADLNYVQTLSPPAVRAVQDHLRQAGDYAGGADGVWGHDSQASLERFQRTHGLQVTGTLNQATVTMLGLNPMDLLGLQPPPPPVSGQAAGQTLSPDAVRSVQGRLREYGFYNGQIDGIWGPSMQTALERFQQGRGLQATGQVTPATATALGLDPNNLSAAAPH